MTQHSRIYDSQSAASNSLSLFHYNTSLTYMC